MWKTLFELVRQVLRLAEEMQQNRADLKELQRGVRDLSHKAEQEVRDIRQEFARDVRELRTATERLAYELQRVSERDEAERQKLILQLENQMLRFERRLAPPKPADESIDKT